MSVNPLHLFVEVTVATSLAVLVVALLRKPLRYLAGAQVAYWLWLLVPASIFAVLLPAPVDAWWAITKSVPHLTGVALNTGIPAEISHTAPIDYTAAGLAVWVLGSLLMLALMIKRQQIFVRSLGEMPHGPEGAHRSPAISGPMLIGVWRPRVVLPADFEMRYSAEERALVLEHELAHRERGDVQLNAIATVWLCFSWFNPLMYWAIGRFRFDQELACDALVLGRRDIGRREYANALLKTQLANDAGWQMPVGCHWQSNHPLKERIAMLKRPLPGSIRRLSGAAGTLAFIASGGYAVWAAQPGDNQVVPAPVAAPPLVLSAAGVPEGAIEVVTGTPGQRVYIVKDGVVQAMPATPGETPQVVLRALDPAAVGAHRIIVRQASDGTGEVNTIGIATAPAFAIAGGVTPDAAGNLVFQAAEPLQELQFVEGLPLPIPVPVEVPLPPEGAPPMIFTTPNAGVGVSPGAPHELHTFIIQDEVSGTNKDGKGEKRVILYRAMPPAAASAPATAAPLPPPAPAPQGQGAILYRAVPASPAPAPAAQGEKGVRLYVTPAPAPAPVPVPAPAPAAKGDKGVTTRKATPPTPAAGPAIVPAPARAPIISAPATK